MVPRPKPESAPPQKKRNRKVKPSQSQTRSQWRKIPKRRLPPVIIARNDDLTLVRNKLRKKNVEFTKAKITGNITKIFPRTSADFQNLTKKHKRGHIIPTPSTMIN